MTRHSSTEQDCKMMEALRNGPVSTIEAAKDLDIVQPPTPSDASGKRVTKFAPTGRTSPPSQAGHLTASPSTS